MKSILIVRTLQESLTETKITSLKRKRQIARIQINNIMKNNGSYENYYENDIIPNFSSSSIRTSSDKYVAFDKISVREYELIWGDNPSVLNGHPLGIGSKSDLCYTTVQSKHRSMKE